MHPIAYFSDTVTIESAKIDPFWKDLLQPAGPWSFASYKLKERKGVLAIQVNPDTKTSYTIKDVAEPIQVDEHLWYFPAKELPIQEELGKSDISMDTEDVILNSGRTLTIPLIRSAPRLLNSRNYTKGYADPLGKLGEEVFDLFVKMNEAANNKEALDDNFHENLDKKCLKLVYMAVSKCYKVTEDLLDQLEWLSNADVMPILEVMFGLEKK